ncbi:MAG TPA: VIT domain-containing protein [Verrucomicrobiae bacterium]
MKRFISFLAALVLVTSAWADGFIVVQPPDHGPRPQPPVWPGLRPYVFAPLEVAYHHVKVKIDGQVAVTTVDEEFYNPNPQRLEGTYLFPAPKDSHIDKFAMDIGGKQVQAELLPADKARQIFEDIVRKMRDPALMEYADRDVFKVRIFPIEPNSRKRVTLSYTQMLKADSGLVSYVYPLNTEKFSAKPVQSVQLDVEVSSDRPLKTIYSPSHEVNIRRHSGNHATVSYEARDVLPDTDFALYFAPEKDDLGVNFLAHRTAGEDGYFLLLASPGLDAPEEQIMPKDVAFVLDTSGSMAGKKLEQAKKALRFCVENLNDNDRFEIIRFSTEVEPLFNKLAKASDANRDQANSFIKDLKAIGGTDIDDALRQALSLRPEQSQRPFVVIFLTDGMPTVGTTDENQIVADVQKAGGDRTRVFCFGIGGDVNTHLLDKITEQTRAFSQYVLPEEDIEVKVSNFFAKIKDPVLANPTIKFTAGVRATKLYPSPLPDLFRGDQLVLAGRYSGEGSSAVILEGTVNGERKQFTYEVSFPRHSDDNEFIPRLWATRRVGYLLDEIRLHGEGAELRDEVTQLARQFNIVTPYTAYLIVEDEGRRKVPLAMQSLPQLYSDRLARREAVDNWNSFKQETGGDKALAGARYGMALKSATVPAAAAANGALEANRALGFSGSGGNGMPATTVAPGNSTIDSKARLANYSQQGQMIAGKNFFQNNSNQWVDSLVQQNQSLKRERIQFNSTQYFQFAATHAKALPWLALGQNVQFVLDGTLYDIYE